MRAFYQKGHIRSVSVTDSGLTEVTFKDNSRYIGQSKDDVIEGRGTLYIQDIGKMDCRFFNSQAVDGTLFFDNVMLWEGAFDDEERPSKGTLELTQTRESIRLTLVGGRVVSLTVLPDRSPVGFDITKPAAYETVLDSGLILSVSADGTNLVIKKTYSNGLLQGDYLSINWRDEVFIHNVYEFNQLKGLQRELHLNPTPYTRTYRLNPLEPTRQSFKMASATGYAFESEVGWEKGSIKEAGKDYVYHGGIDGCQRSGPAVLSFQNDSCELPITCLQDKLVFDNVEAVFEYVKSFDCSRHPQLRFSENMARVKFIENLESFEGKLQKGNSVGAVTMGLPSGLIYQGPLVDFKMQGRGTIGNDKWKATGEFVRGELKYGVVVYTTGARYEGQLLDYNRSGTGKMRFVNNYVYQGEFLNDRVTRKDFGTLTLASGRDSRYLAVDLADFDLCVLLPQKDTDGLLVWSYTNDRIYDATFLDKLKSSGIDIRESLRNIRIN